MRTLCVTLIIVSLVMFLNPYIYYYLLCICMLLSKCIHPYKHDDTSDVQVSIFIISKSYYILCLEKCICTYSCSYSWFISYRLKGYQTI